MNTADPSELLTQPPTLPAPYAARRVQATDVNQIVALALADARALQGPDATVPRATLEAQVTGAGSWTRRQVVVTDADDRIVGWAWAHDRAAGRTIVDYVLAPTLPDPDPLAAAVLDWITTAALALAAARGLAGTTLDCDVDSSDTLKQTQLRAAGFHCARTWLHMTRPVTPAQTDRPAPPADVRVRPIERLSDGSPVAEDLQAVHLMLEESFADHFNSYRESLPEFLTRMREEDGHRWSQWWLAEFRTDDGAWVPGGAVVGQLLPPDASGIEGTYIAYLGVHRAGRGKGLSKAMLNTVIADAAANGRNRVDLEVDADSPTKANEIYAAQGWVTERRSETWHRDVGEESPTPKQLAD